MRSPASGLKPASVVVGEDIRYRNFRYRSFLLQGVCARSHTCWQGPYRPRAELPAPRISAGRLHPSGALEVGEELVTLRHGYPVARRRLLYLRLVLLVLGHRPPRVDGRAPRALESSFGQARRAGRAVHALLDPAAKQI